MAALGLYFSQFAQLDAQATLFPRLVGYPVAAFVLLSLAIQTLPSLRRLRGDDTAERVRLKPFLAGPALAAGYLALWTPLGFQLDTVVLLIVAPLVLGHSPRRLPLFAAIGVATAVLFAFLFHLGSGAILPTGFLHAEWP